MILLNALLLLIPGFLAVKYFFRDTDAGLLEKTGLLIFFSLTLVPFFNINYALLNGRYLGFTLIILTSVSLSIIFTVLIIFGARSGQGKNASYLEVLKNNVTILLDKI